MRSLVLTWDPLPPSGEDMDQVLLEEVVDHILEVHSHDADGAASCLMCLRAPAARVLIGLIRNPGDLTP